MRRRPRRWRWSAPITTAGRTTRTIDEIDTHQRLVQHPLRSQRPVGVVQELSGLLVAHYAVRANMTDAAAQAEIAPTSLSFTQSVELIRVAIALAPEGGPFQLVEPAAHQQLYQRLLRDIATCRLPSRARRTNPRVVKRKMSKFALKRGKPTPPSQQLVAFETTIQILPQPAPQHQILDQPLPLDGTVDTPRSVQCLI